MIGTGTALTDNPHLVPANSKREVNPVRIVLGDREISENFHLYDTTAETIFLKGHSFETLLALVMGRSWNRVLVESGAGVGSALLKAGLIDEIHIFIAPTLLGSGKSFVEDLGITTLAMKMDFQIAQLRPSGSDIEVLMIKEKVGK